MENPEKVYIYPRITGKAGERIATLRKYDGSVEYTRTDAFIEKAKTFICNHIDGSGLHLNYILKEFENYMKGE